MAGVAQGDRPAYRACRDPAGPKCSGRLCALRSGSGRCGVRQGPTLGWWASSLPKTSSSSWHDGNEAQPLACVLLEPQLHSFADPKYEILPGDISAGVKLATESVAALNLQTNCRDDIPRRKFWHGRCQLPI